ncbi:MAG: RHS repeat-associated core domain-containing protein [Holophagales bacterium]|nr:MAG: RHS repeat-associated core domain-containing protein [Holophagales bacterium]
MPSTSQPSRARAHEPEGRAAHSSSPACFEPFGEDWSNARSFGLNLRLPGQWDDAAWNNTQIASGLYYNLHRWYEVATDRYESVDPAPSELSPKPYLYAASNPNTYADPLGLFTIAPDCGGFRCGTSLGDCAAKQDATCVLATMNHIRREIAGNAHCKSELAKCGGEDFTDMLLPIEGTKPFVQCDQSPCWRTETGGLSVANIFTGGSPVLCQKLFRVSWRQAAQSMFHEILHVRFSDKSECHDGIMKACFASSFDP